MTPEVKADIIRRYQAGEKAIVIQNVHKISAGALYYLLHKCGVELRGPTKPTKQTSGSTKPTKQTSALQEAATRVIKQPIPKDVEPLRQLIEQAGIEVQRFCTEYAAACAECKEGYLSDAYMELWYDFITELPQLINRLVEKVGPDSGITLGLIALRGIIESIEALDPDKGSS